MFAAIVAQRLSRIGIHYGWVMVALTMLTTICSSASVSLSGVLILPMIQEFGWSRTDVSSATGLMFITFATMVPFTGALIYRFGLRKLVTVAALTTATTLATITQASAQWHLLITFGLLLGASAALLASVLSATVASRWFGERRGVAMGVLTAAFAAGQLTFLPTAAWLASDFGWRIAVLPVLVGAVVSAILYFLLARDWPSEINMAPYGENHIQPPATIDATNVLHLSFSVLQEALGTRIFWILSGTFFVCGLSSTGLVNQHFIPFCADYGVAAVTAASFLALIGVFNFIGTIGSGWLSDRFDNRALLSCYYGLRGLSLIWLPLSNFDMITLSVFAVFFGLDYVATVPPTLKLVRQHFGSVKAPIVFGWVFACHQAGGASSAYFSGVGRDLWLSYSPVYFAIGATCLIASIAILGARSVAAEEPLQAIS